MMKQNLTEKIRRIELIKTFFMAVFFISAMVLNAQTPTDFSGKWEFDKARSDKDDRGDASFDGIIILEINQNFESITFSNTFFRPGRDGITLRPNSCLIDGTVTPDDTGSDPAKKFAEWSQDKKILTINYIMTATIDGEAQDFLTANTYKLSDDGKTLLVEEYHKSKLNGEKTIKKVYSKK